MFKLRRCATLVTRHILRNKFEYRGTVCGLSSKMDNDNPKETYTNKLIHERSPYLLQHAHNPVNWYTWGEEAFEKARKEDKLIFLSIGYSTCHWCHVMERESFENADIAEMMNNNFVNIKVDREERPDIDQMYTTYVMLCNQTAGWPLSVFLTPNLVPVFGGTYYPPTDRGGIIGFPNILQYLLRLWVEDKQSVIDVSQRATQMTVMAKSSININKDLKILPDIESCLKLCVTELLEKHDPLLGRFSLPPKFPQTTIINFLFHYHKTEYPQPKEKDEALSAAKYTLDMMANGGICDHVGQGFARYSTDSEWHVPHFEKMLYDQAQMAVAYGNAYLITNSTRYGNTAIGVLTYTLRDLKHPKGVFYSAEDADSYPFEGAENKIEGAFYVWTYEEIENALSVPLTCKENILLSDLVIYYYNVKKGGNTEYSSIESHDLEGLNVLIAGESEKTAARKFGLSTKEFRTELKLAKELLLAERNKRPRPFMDTKIIVSWNGLMLSGLSKVARITHLEYQELYEDYKAAALQLAQAIEKYFWIDGRLLLHCGYTSEQEIVHGDDPVEGFLNDYAFLIAGLIDVYEITFEAKWMKWALKLQKIQNELFWNSEKSLFDMSASNQNDSKTEIPLKNFIYEDYDGSEPSGNSVSLSNLIRLGSVFHHEEFHEMAQQLLCSYSMTLMEHPYQLTSMVSNLLNFNKSLTTFIIRGQLDDKILEEMIKIIHSKYIPDGLLLNYDIYNDGDGDFYHYFNMSFVDMIKDFVNTRNDDNEKPSISICSKHSCRKTVYSKEELLNYLESC